MNQLKVLAYKMTFLSLILFIVYKISMKDTQAGTR